MCNDLSKKHYVTQPGKHPGQIKATQNKMKKAWMTYGAFVLLPLIGCKQIGHPKNHLSSQESEGLWVIYALNFAHGDSMFFKKRFPDKNYNEFLKLDIVPGRKDTLDNGNLYIGYSPIYEGEYLFTDVLFYYGVSFDSTGSINKVFFEDVVVFEFNPKEVPEAALLADFINNNKRFKFSKTLLEVYKSNYGKN